MFRLNSGARADTPKFSRYRLVVALIATIWFAEPASTQDPSRDQAVAAMRKAVDFFRQHAGYRGAYVYRVSSDLKLREGEGKGNAGTGWIEPPGTPSVGLAFLQAYQLTGEPDLLDAAKETAYALLHGQLVSGGWSESVEWLPEHADRYAYRSHGETKKRRNLSTLDDDKSQSAVRFLMLLDHELKQQDGRIHEAVEYALQRFLAAQYPIGAWPQRFEGPADPSAPVRSASYPDDWPRTFPKQKYSHFYTLNDNTISDTIGVMLLAYDIYGDKRYFQSALSGTEFFLRAQMPDPQPAWAQQYSPEMNPVWARKFEPPAVTGGESQGVMRTLLTVYRRHRDPRYLEAVDRALRYLDRSTRPDGKLARFYELKTNRPLYFTKDYRLTYSDDDMPTHYGFIVGSRLDSIRKQWLQLAADDEKSAPQSPRRSVPGPPQMGSAKSLAKRAAEVIEALDERGAWVESGDMRNFGNPTGKVIESRTFAKRLLVLAGCIHALR